MAVVIVLAGVRLTRVADTLSERTGLGDAVGGALLLGALTSLPGIVTGAHRGAGRGPGIRARQPDRRGRAADRLAGDRRPALPAGQPRARGRVAAERPAGARPRRAAGGPGHRLRHPRPAAGLDPPDDAAHPGLLRLRPGAAATDADEPMWQATRTDQTADDDEGGTRTRDADRYDGTATRGCGRQLAALGLVVGRRRLGGRPGRPAASSPPTGLPSGLIGFTLTTGDHLAARAGRADHRRPDGCSSPSGSATSSAATSSTS